MKLDFSALLPDHLPYERLNEFCLLYGIYVVYLGLCSHNQTAGHGNKTHLFFDVEFLY